jgi:signal recognition particle GTPase
MVDLNARVQRVIEEILGNEALLEMLETDAAAEMLNWGTAMATSLVKKTNDLDDFAANLAILPRLKAVRQSMRSIGNWAVGKYADPASRVELRDKLLERFRVIFGENARLPSIEQFDELLNQVDNKNNTPYQLILKLKQLLEGTVKEN